MTDQQTYREPEHGNVLAIKSNASPYLNISIGNGAVGYSLHIRPAELLAMIDAADPDAMRAYLRETVEPERTMTVTIEDLAGLDLGDLVDRAIRGFDGSLTDPRLPAHIAAGIAEQLLPTLLERVPEADSPEDVDEQPLTAADLKARANQLQTDADARARAADLDTRLYVVERLVKVLAAGTDAIEVCTLADWVIER